MYTRNIYLEKLRPFIDKPVIKVLTGMRRVGKSYLLRQIGALLSENHHVFLIDKESLEFEHVATYRDLHQAVLDELQEAKRPLALLVDEVQEIVEWERAVASLTKREDIDIYLTGSNAHLLSSELATLLSGRYIQLQVHSLGLREHLQFREVEDAVAQKEFELFLRYGGLPALHHFDLQDDVVYQYVGSVFHTVLLKDVVKRHGIRNVELLERLARYLCDNIGNTMSAKSIADYLKSQRLSVGVDTVQNYLRYFTDALVAHRVPRYDIQGKRHLEVHEKYYLEDIGIRHALLGFREGDIQGLLENIVYLELIRRGYGVSVGKFGDREIDFIATRENEKLYIQVAYLLASEATVRREFDVLLDVPDNYPKYVLSMDPLFGSDREGIKRLHLVEFLLGAQ